MRISKQGSFKKIFLVFVTYSIVSILALIMLFPIIWLFLQSLKQPLDTIAQPPKFVFLPTLDNFKEVLSRPGIIKSFVDSLTIALCSVGLAIAVGAPAAYSFARFKYKGKEDIAFFLLTTRMMPYIVVLIPFLRIFARLGINDSYAGMIPAHVLLNLALVVWMLRAFFLSISPEIEEAALLDGCGWWSVITHIVLPLAIPGLAATAVLSFIFSWNDLLFGYALTSSEIRTIPVRFSTEFIGYTEINWGAISAAGILATAPVLILVVLVEKHLVRGFTLGVLGK